MTSSLHPQTSAARALPSLSLAADLVVGGGGLSGLCCAITAARQGAHVILVQDRPVLGGNASSEVRLWVLGATSHMGNNNRWAREGGVIDEILVENLYRNSEGNAVLFDSILLEWAIREPNLHLLLNTAIDSVDLAEDGSIARSYAFCSQNQTRYILSAPLFCDASGDGILGFLAGAAFRMGSESHHEFNELLAPESAGHDLLGHSLYFYSRDTGRPVQYVAPAFALADIRQIPRFRDFKVSDSGCRLWWLEYGGNLDTVYETEKIKWELWRIAYGVWNYIKNSGEFPEAANLTLEWMGTIPGKRESRRFEGDLILCQQDIVEQTMHPDAVSYGGWAIDLHPSDGVFSAKPGCEQWHSKGVFQIPYRTMYSRNVPNLFVSGRLISATHIAFGSTRVMATCAHNGQAVGAAAAICAQRGLRPRDLLEPEQMLHLQRTLLRTGQHIPGLLLVDPNDLAGCATVSASSTNQLAELAWSGDVLPLADPVAMLVPLLAGASPKYTVQLAAREATTLVAELWMAKRPGNTTPDSMLERLEIPVDASATCAEIHFTKPLPRATYGFIVLQPNPAVTVHLNNEYVPGLLLLKQKMNAAVAKSTVQTPSPGSGVETFPFWLPDRRPVARLLAMRFSPALTPYAPAHVINGCSRPWEGASCWVPSLEDSAPSLTLTWSQPQTIRVVEITFDTDYDHPMESVLMGHPERVMPGCVSAFELRDASGAVLATCQDNHHTRVVTRLAHPVTTSALIIHILAHGPALPAIFQVRCF